MLPKVLLFRMGNLERASEYLKESLFLYKTLSPNLNYISKIKKYKYLCKDHLQICALLSQSNLHEEAHLHAKLAAKYSHSLIYELLEICQGIQFQNQNFNEINQINVNKDYDKTKNINANLDKIDKIDKIDTIAKIAKNQNKNQINMNISNNLLNNEEKQKLIIYQHLFYKPIPSNLARKLIPILQELINRLIPEKKSQESSVVNPEIIKIEMKNLFGFLPQSDWGNLNIGNIMQISPLTLNDIFSINPLSLELLRESILDCVSLIAVSYFSISTEKRFLAEAKQYSNITYNKSEFFHAKSLEITCIFLPMETPLYSHILMSYQKHHSPMNQAIPEESEINDNLQIIKPISGLVPLSVPAIIRSHMDQKYSISPLPMEFNEEFDIINLIKTTEDFSVEMEHNSNFNFNNLNNINNLNNMNNLNNLSNMNNMNNMNNVNFAKSFDKSGKMEDIENLENTENKNLSDNDTNIDQTNSMYKRKVNTEVNSNNIIGISKSEIRHKINGRPKTSYNLRAKKPPNKSNVAEEGNKSCLDSYSKSKIDDSNLNFNFNSNSNSKSPDSHALDFDSNSNLNSNSNVYLKNQGGSAQKASIHKNIKVKFALNDGSKEKHQAKIRPIPINKMNNEKSKIIEALLERPKSKLSISKFHKGLKNLGMIYLESKKRTKTNSKSKEKESPFNLNHSFL